MKKYLFLFSGMLFLQLFAYAQQGQQNISRIDKMPDLPSPYSMRDWKEVAIAYDNFIFDLNKSGQYLPLITLKPEGYNYPELEPILLKTYVGAPGAGQAEAINIIPALVSASLMGIDKSDQSGINWVAKAKDFYNKRNNQHVYLNGYNATSGNDWWYDLMPNVFFYQLYSFYPDEPQFREQFISVADQWLKAVYAMGGSTTPWAVPQMNYRAWNLATMTGNPEGVKEPESAGTIAWLLYQAYQQTGEKKYLQGAQLALDFLSGLSANPSYELQLPYGTLTAAKLNAEYGAGYPLDKMLDWSFEKGELRGWGTIVGKWDGKDVSGLVGEANDGGNDYAFMMNGYQQAAALVPLVKYDKRYARAIAIWTLNLANASRLFYPKFLEETKQDDFVWSAAHDPESVIGYEALKENWEGKALYGTGDAKRNGWAATNLALYGSSHAGYLAAIVAETDVEGILQLDLNKTDFFGDQHFASYLIYNPHAADQQITLRLGSNAYDIYDAISETDVAVGATGNIQLLVKAGEVVLLTYLPAGTPKSERAGKLYSGQHVIDYHYGYNFAPAFRIKALAAEREQLEFGEQTSIYAQLENTPAAVVYNWYVNGVFLSTSSEAKLDWTAPEAAGEYNIRLEVTSGSKTLRDSLMIAVSENIPQPPSILAITTDKKFYYAGSTAHIICTVEGAATENFTYSWSVSRGTMVQDDSLLIWTSPGIEGVYTITCQVTNSDGLTAEAAIKVLVKQEGGPPTDPLAYYPLNINTNDYGGNDYHAIIRGTREAADALGIPDFAYRFAVAEDVIFVEANPAFNFQEATTLAFWLSPGTADHEAFILSHGSWEERWKVSITPEGKLRWTVKTESGVRDLDSAVPLTLNQWVHITVVYTGYSMELYLNGQLDTFLEHSGQILTSSKAITFGQKSLDETQFYLRGLLDEVRFYSVALNPDKIELLKTMWQDESVTGIDDSRRNLIRLYPNPAQAGRFWITLPFESIQEAVLTTLEGVTYPVNLMADKSVTKVHTTSQPAGLYILKIMLQNEIRYFKIILE
jgi:hypothetical protein